MECANVIVDLEPTPFNLSNKAVLLWFLGHVDESFKILDDILHNCEDYKDAFNNKSIFLYELGRYDEALELCDYVLVKNPHFWMPYVCNQRFIMIWVKLIWHLNILKRLMNLIQIVIG